VILCVAAWNYRHLQGIEAVLVMNSVRALRKEPQRHPLRVFYPLGSGVPFERNNRVAGSSLFSLYGLTCGRNVRACTWCAPRMAIARTHDLPPDPRANFHARAFKLANTSGRLQ